jgi:predicted nucleic acid-binding protein
LVIAEAGWLIRRQLDLRAEVLLYRTIADGQLAVETLTNADWARIGELVDTYTDIGLDAADESIIAIAERFDQTAIATLDERDFRIVRPNHTDAFELLPRPT